MSKPSQDELEKALSDASSAHHDYEKVTLAGTRDEQCIQWCDWNAYFNNQF